MHIYDESTQRRTRWSVSINWSRELTFSPRQASFILRNVPKARGVYCIYAKCCSWDYKHRNWPTKRRSRVVYIGSGWLHQRLSAHLLRKKNPLLNDHCDKHELAYRFDRVADDDPDLDWPRTVEAHLLEMFIEKFKDLPPANRKEETVPNLDVDEFIIEESSNFSVFSRS